MSANQQIVIDTPSTTERAEKVVIIVLVLLCLYTLLTATFELDQRDKTNTILEKELAAVAREIAIEFRDPLIKFEAPSFKPMSFDDALPIRDYITLNALEPNVLNNSAPDFPKADLGTGLSAEHNNYYIIQKKDLNSVTQQLLKDPPSPFRPFNKSESTEERLQEYRDLNTELAEILRNEVSEVTSLINTKYRAYSISDVEYYDGEVKSLSRDLNFSRANHQTVLASLKSNIKDNTTTDRAAYSKLISIIKAERESHDLRFQSAESHINQLASLYKKLESYKKRTNSIDSCIKALSSVNNAGAAISTATILENTRLGNACETKVDPTKVDPTKVDPTKVDSTEDDSATDGSTKVDSTEDDSATDGSTKVDSTEDDSATDGSTEDDSAIVVLGFELKMPLLADQSSRWLQAILILSGVFTPILVGALSSKITSNNIGTGLMTCAFLFFGFLGGSAILLEHLEDSFVQFNPYSLAFTALIFGYLSGGIKDIFEKLTGDLRSAFGLNQLP